METTNCGKYKFICFTEAGRELMLRIKRGISCEPTKESGFGPDYEKAVSLSEWTGDNFRQGNILVFIGATGIAVRAIAPFCRDKATDPGVVVIDEKGSFVIPLLSGHIGGSVEAARELAAVIGATAVITTATDVNDEFAVDVFAGKNNLGISDMKEAKAFSARLLAGEEVQFTVSPRMRRENGLALIPRCTVAGMGCRRGKSCDELYAFLTGKLRELEIDVRSLKALVSIDKKADEQGLIELAQRLNIPFLTYSAEFLMEQGGDFAHSDLVMEATGADNVCERAVAAYGYDRMVLHKTSKDGMTLALGMLDVLLKE